MKLKGSGMIISSLKEEKTEVIFGYPGGAVLPLYDALYDADIRHILSRHEQGAIHAADGYARASGKPGVVFATSGPGATNLVTGIATAYMDSVPLVIITGQVGTSFIGTDGFQEADITGITLPVTKHNYLVKDVREIPTMIKEAFHIAATGRPGPVLIDVPKDIQDQESEFVYPDSVDIPGYRPTIEGHPGQISRALKAIGEAKKPLIIGGGGIIRSGAGPELAELARIAGIPVTLTLMGLGGIPGSDPLFLGMLGMHGTRAANYAVMQCDLLVAIGMRFDDRVTGNLQSFAPNASVIHIDIDPAEIGKNIKVDIPIVGDVKTILSRMLKKIKPAPEQREDWLRQVKLWKEEFPSGSIGCLNTQVTMKPQDIIREILRLTAPQRTIIATDVGQHQMWTAQHYCFSSPRTFISSGGLGTMGYGFPAALGAQVAVPDSLVFAISGDGSFQMNIQELATAVNYNIPVKIAIINNGYLGMVRQWQELFFNSRYSSTTLTGNPDFVKVAEAYGVKGLRAETPPEVTAVIEEAIDSDGPVLIDFSVEVAENVFPMVAPNRPLNDIIDRR